MNRRAMMGGAAGVLSAGFLGLAPASGADVKSGDVCGEGCADCLSTCLACATACLDEPGRKECIKLCLDCADICDACTKISARKGPLVEAMMALCADACDKCAAECEKHKDDKTCKACAERCRACAMKCRDTAKVK